MIAIDIQMPRYCAECPCLRLVKGLYQCGVTGDMRKGIDRKPINCPLIDVADDGK